MSSFPILVKSIFLLVSSLGQADYQQKPAEPQKHEPQQKEPQKQVEDSWLVSTSATVEAIDHKTRMVTIRGPQGNTSTFKVGDSVKNLDQVKVGDRVTVDYYQSLAVQVIKVGSAESSEEQVVESAAPGEEPGMAAAKKVTVVATVEAIDHAAPSITLKDEKGNVTTVKVRHPERLKLVKVGDTLKITYREAVAVAVEPPPKTAK
jgi:hypothetical protein